MPKTYKYEEGKEAQENFEKGMNALFQVPKGEFIAVKKARKKRAKQKSKSSESDPSRDPEGASGVS